LENFKLAAKTFAGLEPVLAKEIKAIGGINVQEGRRIVFYEGDYELVYKSNFFCVQHLEYSGKLQYFSLRTSTSSTFGVKR
jgi:putative N6-adenine-specific DNA methylase